MSARVEQRTGSDAWISRAAAKPVGVRGTFQGQAAPIPSRRPPTDREMKMLALGWKRGFRRGFVVGCVIGFALGVLSALLLVSLR